VCRGYCQLCVCVCVCVRGGVSESWVSGQSGVSQQQLITAAHDVHGMGGQKMRGTGVLLGVAMVVVVVGSKRWVSNRLLL
jgi:hypothetical protein